MIISAFLLPYIIALLTTTATPQVPQSLPLPAIAKGSSLSLLKCIEQAIGSRMGRYATLCVLYTFIYFPQKKFQRDGKDQSIQ
ncbi:MAG TPA: hypothetical protein PKN86_03000, partial [Candidatus Obscuribacter sp.]|nr:hypothetical protein [Candidatus Obscuribacter sp.]